MSFNKYGVYSTLSQVENSNNKEYEECIKLIESMEEISTKDSAKEFLKNTWNYTDYSKKKTIVKDCVLSVKENRNSLVISFDSLNAYYVYSYTK